jgi:hypothetical protein
MQLWKRCKILESVSFESATFKQHCGKPVWENTRGENQTLLTILETSSPTIMLPRRTYFVRKSIIWNSKAFKLKFEVLLYWNSFLMDTEALKRYRHWKKHWCHRTLALYVCVYIYIYIYVNIRLLYILYISCDIQIWNWRKEVIAIQQFSDNRHQFIFWEIENIKGYELRTSTYSW